MKTKAVLQGLFAEENDEIRHDIITPGLIQRFTDRQNMARLIGGIFITGGPGFKVYNPSHSGMIIKRGR